MFVVNESGRGGWQERMSTLNESRPVLVSNVVDPQYAPFCCARELHEEDSGLGCTLATPTLRYPQLFWQPII